MPCVAYLHFGFLEVNNSFGSCLDSHLTLSERNAVLWHGNSLNCLTLIRSNYTQTLFRTLSNLNLCWLDSGFWWQYFWVCSTVGVYSVGVLFVFTLCWKKNMILMLKNTFVSFPPQKRSTNSANVRNWIYMLFENLSNYSWIKTMDNMFSSLCFCSSGIVSIHKRKLTFPINHKTINLLLRPPLPAAVAHIYFLFACLPLHVLSICFLFLPVSTTIRTATTFCLPVLLTIYLL